MVGSQFQNIRRSCMFEGTYLRTSDVLARGACDVSPHTRTHDTDHPWGGSSLAARRSQPSSLAVSRLTVNAVKDLNGGASLGFLGQELRRVFWVRLLLKLLLLSGAAIPINILN